MSRPDNILSGADRNRLVRWNDHLEESGLETPDQACFLSFGSLSTLERLHRALALTAPQHCGPLRAAIQEKRKAKRRRAQAAQSGGQRGPARTLSVARDELPTEWLTELDEMERARRHLDRGGLHLSGPRPPSAASIKDMTYVLRAIAMSSRTRGMDVGLRKPCISAWLDDAEARGCGARGLGLQIGMLLRFARKALGKKAKLTRQLISLRKTYAARGRREQKRKERFLLENPKTLGGIWLQSESLLEKSGLEPAGSFARQKLLLDAAALALAIVVPLRIGDLHRFRIGEHLTRSATGWHLRIRTRKTGAEYDRHDLWPELSPFLDALILADAPGADLWAGYDARQGTPIFSRDGGKTGLSGDWISDVWEAHVGCGAHIVRTLWHQTVWESDRDGTWIALALCGQDSERTATEYRVENAKRQAVRDARQVLRTAWASFQTTPAGGSLPQRE